MSEFEAEFQRSAHVVITELSLALHSTMFDGDKGSKENNKDSVFLTARLCEVGPVLRRCSLRADQLSHFVSVHGTVVRIGQMIRLQETRSDSPAEEDEGGTGNVGGMPRHLSCVLLRDLVDSCVPGDEVIVSGVVMAETTSTAAGNNPSSVGDCLFTLMLQANNVIRLREKRIHGTGDEENDGEGAETGTASDAEFSMKELYAIEAIHAEPSLFRLLVASLCPSIFGHELVKASLLLALFGGVTKFAGDRDRVAVRGNCHVLIVGDPGLGKSQMLQAACTVAPRSVYVCGSTSSSAGLTVTFCRDNSSEGSLEAGALLISDQGCCCIDEFDKMSLQQHSSLLEAMEQQSISVAKSGLVCTLSARTTVLAAANPASGHYDKARTVSENLRLSTPLLSRFDLVYIMLDRPNEVQDSRLSRHVLSLHGSGSGSRSGTGCSGQMDSKSFESLVRDPDSSLLDRLSYSLNEEVDPIPVPLLRKYIAYARKYVQPKLSPEAVGILQELYMSLRRRRQSMDGSPITTRQLESLVRLAEARARAELREIVTAQDAVDVKELMLESMLGVYSDEFGMMDFSRSQGGRGMSKAAATKKVLAMLQSKAQRSGSSLFTSIEIHSLVAALNLPLLDIDMMIDNLNQHGFLLKTGPRLYKLIFGF